jgi:hypothetical protein
MLTGSGHGIPERDAINFPLFQFMKEGGHLRNGVERAISYAEPFSRSH